MNREEKIELVKELLKRYVNFPDNSGLSLSEANIVFNDILVSSENKIDDYISLLTETLEEIGLKIKYTNDKINKMIISDNEEFERNSEQKELNNLFSNF